MTRKTLAAQVGWTATKLASRLRVLDTPPAYWPFIGDATISLDDLPAIIELHTNHTTDTGPLVAALRAGNRTIGHLVTTVRRDLIRASRIVEITAAAAETGTRIVEWHGE